MDEFVTREKEGKVVTIGIKAAPRDRGELIRLADEMSWACRAIADDGGVTVVVVTGGEDAFHLATLSDTGLPEDEDGGLAPSLAASLAALDRPVLAALDGQVTGQGLELALACDIRIAAEGALFSLPQIQDGLIPGDGGTQRLPRTVGKGKALEMILLGTAMDGREALQTGLVNRLVPSADLMVSVREMAQTMAAQAPFALKYAKEAVSQGLEMNIDQGLRLEADLYFLLHTTSDRREGIEAFLEKRKPRFEGK